MKKVLSGFLTLLALLALTAPAYADAIAGPVDMAFTLGTLLWPALLVAAAVAITLFLIRKFRKK